MTPYIWHLRDVLAIATCLLMALGCGDGDQLSTVPVRGKVLVDGKPLHTGTITFDPENAGPSATGQIQEDGTFEMMTYEEGDGATVGKHGVMIMAIEDPPPGSLPENPVAPKLLVPARYGSPKTSGLTADVKDQDENVLTFELDSR